MFADIAKKDNFVTEEEGKTEVTAEF